MSVHPSTFPQRPPSDSLVGALRGRGDGLVVLRLILASLVIESHSWPIGGYGHDPAVGGTTLGRWAVAGFFCLSGFLVTGSRLHSRGLGDFLWRRLLRIYPGFFVSLIVVALAIAPLSSLLTGTAPFDWSSAVDFIAGNADLRTRRLGIDGTLGEVPLAGVWNGSLWTIAFEAACYLALGVIATVVPRLFGPRGLGPVLIALFGLGCASVFAHETWHLGSGSPGILLLTQFSAGALLRVFGQRVPVRRAGIVAAVILLVAFAPSAALQGVAAVPLAYLLLAAGGRLRLPPKAGRRHDVSYGLYVYAFPVQQLLATVLVGHTVPVGVFAAASVAATLPLAWGSWLLVERPALRWARLFAGGPPPTALVGRACRGRRRS
jgi:peptidoglycan/LPS O-acetylase OafA/YrhL